MIGTSVMDESNSFAPALGAVDQAHSFLVKQLTSTTVTNRLEERKSELDLFDNGHYFELVGNIPSNLDDVQCICAKTYDNNGLCFIMIYFEGVFYCVLSDTSEDEPLLDVEFPDVSQEGDGITLGIYDFNESDDESIQWQKLSLWQSVSAEQSILNNSEFPSENISLLANMYVQTYCILKPNKPDQADRDVMFRFGSWCYTGNVELIEALKIDDIPHVIPALRIQQHKLAYLCDVSSMPEDNLFTNPMMINDQIIKMLESEILTVESALENLRNRAPDFSWIDENLNNIFFEFDSITKDESIFAQKKIDLIATKSYRPNGLVVMTTYFDGTFYVCVNYCDGDQPLLDSEFPSIVRGRGYQLKTYPSGLDALPQLRRLSIWESAEANEKNNQNQQLSIQRESESKSEEENVVERQEGIKNMKEKNQCKSIEQVENSTKEAEQDNPHAQSKTLGQMDSICEEKKDNECADCKGITYKHKTAEQGCIKTEIKRLETNEAKSAIVYEKDHNNSKKRQNLGAFHHLAPLKKASNLEEKSKKIQLRELDKKECRPYNAHGQPLKQYSLKI
jgi:hypothetical protein